MANLKLDATGDLDFSTGNLELITGIEEIRQKLTVRLQFLLGEWVLDQRLGMPYVGNILVKNPNFSVIRSIFRQAILKTPGVESLTRLVFNFDAATRNLRVTFQAIITDSDEPLNYDRSFIIEL